MSKGQLPRHSGIISGVRPCGTRTEHIECETRILLMTEISTLPDDVLVFHELGLQKGNGPCPRKDSIAPNASSAFAARSD